jgi:hypothetical protein
MDANNLIETGSYYHLLSSLICLLIFQLLTSENEEDNFQGVEEVSDEVPAELRSTKKPDKSRSAGEEWLHANASNSAYLLGRPDSPRGLRRKHPFYVCGNAAIYA